MKILRNTIATVQNSDLGLLVLVVGLLLVAGLCRLFTGQASPVPDDKTVVTICKGGFKRDREETKDLRRAFQKTHPDIYVKVIQSNLQRKADTMIAAGVSPDVIAVGVDKVSYYLEADALLDLTPFVEQDPELSARLFGTPAGDPPDFYPQTVTPFVIGENGQRHIYALPVNYTPFIIYYSKDLFDRYNVPYPDENWDWEGLRERAKALTRDTDGRRPDQPGFDPHNVHSYGFQFAAWQHGVENFIRQNGGRLISEDGTRVVADDPLTIEALEFLHGLKHRDRVVPPAAAQAQQVNFRNGRIGMYLGGIFTVPTLRDQAPNLDWDVAPLPRGPRGQRASIVYTNAWGISKQCQDPEAAFALLRFLTSDEGLAIIGKHAVFLPCRRSVLKSSAMLDPSHKPHSTWALTYDMDYGHACPPFATKQDYADVYQCINDHFDKLLQKPNPPFTPTEAAQSITRQGNTILRRDRSVRASGSFGMIVLLAAGAPLTFLLFRLARRRSRGISSIQRKEEHWGYLLISPWVVGFAVFAAFPILVSVGLSFAQWQSLGEFTRSEFIGLENYRVAISGKDTKFWPSLWITFRYALLAVPATLVGGLMLAVLMNVRVRGISVFRTLYYLPAILPSVATAVLWWHLFDAHHGWINRVVAMLNAGGWIEQACGWLGIQYPIGWLEDDAVTPYVFIIMALWGVGGGMIIYLAGLQGIPTSLYEAAEIDGAGRWKRFRHVTIPMLSPVILFNLIMGIIGSFQVFNVAFVLFDGDTGPGDSALFYGLHLFREAFFKYRLGYASALAWILFLIVIAFTALVFKSSPMWVHYEARRRERA